MGNIWRVANNRAHTQTESPGAAPTRERADEQLLTKSHLLNTHGLNYFLTENMPVFLLA